MSKIRLTKKVRNALSHLRQYGRQQKYLSEFDAQFERLAEAGLVKVTRNGHGEVFFSLTIQGDNLAATGMRY